MTKYVRVENADSSTYKVRVVIQDKIYEDGVWLGEWRDIKVVELNHPTAMMHNEYITSSRRFIVEEFE